MTAGKHKQAIFCHFYQVLIILTDRAHLNYDMQNNTPCVLKNFDYDRLNMIEPSIFYKCMLASLMK